MGLSPRRTVRPHGTDARSCSRAVFLSNVYPVEFNAGNRKRVYSSMAFAGTVVGQLTFGASAIIRLHDLTSQATSLTARAARLA